MVVPNCSSITQINADPAITVRTGSSGQGCGDFLCEYLAYHDAWYVSWSQANQDFDIFEKAEMGGFTHVVADVLALGGPDALLTQLRVVIEELEKNY